MEEIQVDDIVDDADNNAQIRGHSLIDEMPLRFIEMVQLKGEQNAFFR